MELNLRSSVNFQEGMRVSELRQNTSINFINSLRENKLININPKGKICLTQKGKIASKFGVDKYLKLEKTEKEFIDKEIYTARIDKHGLLMIFGGMFISLLLIIGFWAIQLNEL